MIGIVNNATDVLNVGPGGVAGVTTRTRATNHDLPNALTRARSPPGYSPDTRTQPDDPADDECRITSR